jgi:hypothetical protein
MRNHFTPIIRLLLGEKKPKQLVWWYTPITPELGKLRQEDYEFEASLSCLVIFRAA